MVALRLSVPQTPVNGVMLNIRVVLFLVIAIVFNDNNRSGKRINQQKISLQMTKWLGDFELFMIKRSSSRKLRRSFSLLKALPRN